MGKTTLSLAASFFWARKQDKVLYVEIGEQSSAARLLGCQPLTYNPTLLEKNLYGLKITGRESLHDYLVRQIRSEKLYRLFFENRPIRYFFDAAPVLRDLMILGKIVHDLDRPDPPGPYDKIIVDAPATGHGLFLFRTPGLVKELTRFGPIFDRTARIADALTDSKTTAIHVVTLGRPIVVGETVELLADLRKTGVPVNSLIVNRLLVDPKTSPDDLQDVQKQKKSPAISLLATRALWELREFRRLKRISKANLSWMSEIQDGTSPDEMAEAFQEGLGDA